MRKILLITLFLVVFYIDSAFGELLENNILGEISDKFRDFSGRWRPVIYRAAYSLFGMLALIEIAWTGITLLIRQADFQEVIGEIVKRVLYIGFFLFLLTFSDDISSAIVNSFQQLARDASRDAGGAISLSPSNLFDSGLDTVKFVIKMMSPWSATKSLGFMIAGIIIMICYAMIAAIMMVTVVEMHIVFNAGIILLGFGANRYTKEYALSYIRYAVSVGVKLFIIQLIVGLGNAVIKDWVSQFLVVNHLQVIVLIGASIVFLALVKNIPSIITGILNGTSFSSGDSIISIARAIKDAMVAAVTAVATGGANLAGGAMAITQAAKFAEEAGATTTAGKTAAGTKALAGAAAHNISERLSNKTIGGRIASQIKKARKKKGP